MTLEQSSPAWMAIRQDVTKKTLELFKEHGLIGWKIVFEDVTSRAGQCNYGKKTIFYSIVFMLHSSSESRLNTIRHEVSHAIMGPGHGHGLAWKRQCLKLGGNTGYSTMLPDSAVTHKNFPWIGTCPNCGQVTGAKRTPQTVWGCAACAPTIPPKGRIYVWSKNGKIVKPSDMHAKYAKGFADLSKSF